MYGWVIRKSFQNIPQKETDTIDAILMVLSAPKLKFIILKTTSSRRHVWILIRYQCLSRQNGTSRVNCPEIFREPGTHAGSRHSVIFRYHHASLHGFYFEWIPFPFTSNCRSTGEEGGSRYSCTGTILRRSACFYYCSYRFPIFPTVGAVEKKVGTCGATDS